LALSISAFLHLKLVVFTAGSNYDTPYYEHWSFASTFIKISSSMSRCVRY